VPIQEKVIRQRRNETARIQPGNRETQVQAALFRNLFQEEVLEGCPPFQEQRHEMIAVQKIRKNRFLGEGETFFLDQEGTGIVDEFIGPDAIRTVFGASSTEQALGQDLAQALAELTFAFTHGLDQPQLPARYEGFFQGFYIDRALAHASTAFYTLPCFFRNFR
jgi:hypothetical protein